MHRFLFASGLFVALLVTSPGSHAAVDGFRDHYVSEVDGQIWTLHLEANRTFSAMVTAKLQLGGADRRYILLGRLNSRQIEGSYKPFLSSTLTAQDQPFTLHRLTKDSIRLRLKNQPDFPVSGVVFTADTALTAVDNALIGIWATEPKLGGHTGNPYLGEQWQIHFRADGSLCEDTVETDKRKPQAPSDPCDAVTPSQWKSEDNRVMMLSDHDWQYKFTYRIMGGRLVVSYPDGMRRVANPRP
jgi:hypothetical protein